MSIHRGTPMKEHYQKMCNLFYNCNHHYHYQVQPNMSYMEMQSTLPLQVCNVFEPNGPKVTSYCNIWGILMALDFADLEISTEVVKRGRWYTLYSFSLVYGFFPKGFPSKVFNEAALRKCITKHCTLFSSIKFLSHWVLLGWSFFNEAYV